MMGKMASPSTVASVITYFLLTITVSAEERTQLWAKSLEDSILILVKAESRIQKLEESFMESSNIELHHVDGSHLVNSMARDVTETFSNKLQALNSVLDEAEKIVLDIKYNPLLQNVSYLNMEAISKNDSNLAYHPQFKQKVDTSRSGVHIPLEIFPGYTEVQNGLAWSERLDDVFRLNLRNNSRLSWQYFGSQVGFIRVFPANRWKRISDTPNVYDVRRRPWYIQGSTSPKDMLILMDTSGSVLGQTFEIMKVAAKKLINTLEENDYVNVAWFNATVGWAACFNTFVQANSRNKRILFSGIDTFSVGQMSSYSIALDFAFQQFQNFSSSKAHYEGAQCHKVIMFFTDGGTERADEIIKKYNEDKEIRIFTYAVGPHATPIHTIKNMSCSNKGYFNTITAMAATNTKIQQYPNVLVRPMALNESRTPSWSTVYTDAGGLGNIISATMPVYNRSIYGRNQSIMGIVGIDTPVAELDALTPYNKVGPIAYSFAINNNGFVIFHPELKTGYSYIEDAPDVDFLDLENDEDAQENLRTNMINSETGLQKITAYTESGDMGHIVRIAMDYFYTPITNTPFSLGLVIPQDRKKYARAKNMKTHKGIPVEEGVLIAFREYCTNITNIWPMDPNATSFSERLSREIKKSDKTCNSQLVQRLLWDIDRTNDWANKHNVSRGVVATFVGTEGGLLRVVPPEQGKFYDDLTTRDPFKAPYYRNGLFYKTWVLVPSNQSRNPEDPTIDVLKSVSGREKQKFAVVGVQIKESLLFEKLNRSFAGIENWHCNDSDSFQCYLLDDGGFVLTTNQDRDDVTKQHGKFFGQVDPALMWELYNRSVYTRREKMDYHSTCSRVQHTSFSARSFWIPSINTFLSSLKSYWLIDIPFWLYIKQWLLLWVSPVAEPRRQRTLTYSCTKRKMQYTYGDQWSQDGVVPTYCGNCTRKFQAERLTQTNLLLVIASAPCGNSACELSEPLHYTPEEAVGPELCNVKPRYRKRPALCFAHHPNEDTSVCSASSRFKMAVETRITTILAALFYFSRNLLPNSLS